jgi:deoxyribonuclease IV
MSVAGGVDRAVARGLAVGCRTMQIFTKNASQWAARPLDPAVVRAFRETLEPAEIAPVVSHGSYLINLASPDSDLRQKSMIAFRDELDRAEALGLMGVVIHPGAHVGAGEDRGLAHVGRGLVRLLAATKKHRVRILIENTAGQGSCLGWSFDHLARLIELAGHHPRIGVCLDTCHLHAAGYDLTSDTAYARTFRQFSRLVGLDRLHCMHLNDSKKPLGSRVDRHTHIGQGDLGLEAFRRIVTDRRFIGVPMILETPKEGEGVAEDRMNLATLAGLA